MKNDDAGLKLETLEKEYLELRSKALAESKKYKENKDPSQAEKKAIRKVFNECINAVRKIEDLTVGPKKDSYHKEFLALVEAMQSLGSSVRGEIPKTTLDDVKGLSAVKALIENFVLTAEHPEILKAYKISTGLGILMYGPPGTGKTLIAEAIANRLDVPFFLVTPADIFKSHVGESEESVKLLFHDLESCEEGCVLFIDECESIFTRRDSNTERYQQAVTTELLQRMNGFGVDGSKRVLIAATNRPEMIDPAYLRFKRFSNLLFIDLPDFEAKKAIILSKLEGMPLEDGLDPMDIVKLANEPGRNFSGADLCGIIEATAMKAIEKIRELPKPVIVNLTYDMFKETFDNYPQTVTDEALMRYRNFKIE